MKFYCDLDEKVFAQELRTANIDEVEFIKKRKELIKGLKDRKKSNITKKDWQKNRFKHMKGIKKFHKSTRGKRFHRNLGRFLATRELKGLAYAECQELVVPITSCLTHSFYELSWYMNIEDQVHYEIFLDEIYEEVLSILTKLKTYPANLEDHEEFLLRVCETASLVTAFADRSGKSKEEVERLWMKAKALVTKEYKLKEDDNKFYSLVVGILKKMLKQPSDRQKVVRPE